jgi:hypothetical protein
MLVALVVLLGGCAQAILPGSGANGPGLTALTVTPSGTAIPGITQQQFTAKTGDGSKPAVSWSVNGIAGGNATLGAIDANGMYTAPEFPPRAASPRFVAQVDHGHGRRNVGHPKTWQRQRHAE